MNKLLAADRRGIGPGRKRLLCDLYGIINVDGRREADPTCDDAERRVEDILRSATRGGDAHTANHVGDGLDGGLCNGGIHHAAPVCLGSAVSGAVKLIRPIVYSLVKKAHPPRSLKKPLENE